MLKQTALQLFFIGLFSLQGLAQHSTASPQVSTFTIQAPQLNSSRKIWLYLPKNYTASTKKYPVIYMPDAQNIFDQQTSFSGEWNVDETLDSLNAEVIVVGIEHGHEKRLQELTPYPHEKYGGGKANDYLEFIVKTLKPTIDKKYRTHTDKKHTMIIGSSLGGLTAYYATLQYPEIFGKAGVFSPAFWINKKDIEQLTQQTQKTKASYYFLCGDQEGEDASMVNDMNYIIQLLQNKGQISKNRLEKVIIKGGQHNEKLWKDAFANAFLWLEKN